MLFIKTYQNRSSYLLKKTVVFAIKTGQKRNRNGKSKPHRFNLNINFQLRLLYFLYVTGMPSERLMSVSDITSWPVNSDMMERMAGGATAFSNSS